MLARFIEILLMARSGRVIAASRYSSADSDNIADVSEEPIEPDEDRPI
jgi:hypothetical protein